MLCEMNGIHSDMLMDIYVKSSKKAKRLKFLKKKNECAVLLLSGKVNFKV